MLCPTCGKNTEGNLAYCTHCASRLPRVVRYEEMQVLSEAPEPALTANLDMPYFGPPVARCWGPFKGKSSYPLGYEWISQRNTLLICEDHLLLINGDEKRSGALDILSAMGLVGGVVSAIRATKDALANNRFNLTSSAATTLFLEMQLIWCAKSDAEIWRYEKKPWMFIKSHADQLYCKFNSMAGTIHCCLVLNSTDSTTAKYQEENEAEFPQTWSGIDIDSLFKVIVIKRDVPDKEIRKVMEASRLNLPDGEKWKGST